MRPFIALWIVASIWAGATGVRAADGLAAMEGLQLWLDAADPATIQIEEGRVARWKDKSPKGFDAVQTNAAARPTFLPQAFGKMPMLHFEQGGQWMATDCVPARGQDPRTILVVVAHLKECERALLAHVVHYGSPVDEMAYGITYRGWKSVNWGNHYWHGSMNSGIPTDSGGGYIVVASYADRADNFAVNGGPTYRADAAWPMGALDTAGASDRVHGLAIGGGLNGGAGTWGDIGEVLAFNRVLTLGELRKLEGHLAHKWGMTDVLPAGHPFKTQRPAP